MTNPDSNCKFSYSRPGAGDGGNTGSWRVLRPVIDTDKCTPARKKTKACFMCWLYCPDGVVSRSIPPTIDYQYCKGCGICAEQCPVNAIEMVEEGGLTVKEED